MFSRRTLCVSIQLRFDSNYSLLAASCKDKGGSDAGGIANVTDEESQKTILQIAAGSKDHTILVKAVQAAGLENSLANQGPFTVFAPTDAAFKALPAGDLDKVMADKDLLMTILGYHVYVGSSLNEGMLTDGDSLSMFDGGSAKISVKNGKIATSTTRTSWQVLEDPMAWYMLLTRSAAGKEVALSRERQASPAASLTQVKRRLYKKSVTRPDPGSTRILETRAE